MTEAMNWVVQLMPSQSLKFCIAEYQQQFQCWFCRGSKIALDIAKGLIYLHSMQIAHLDLKSPNVMLTANDEAKIGDVGLGKLVANPNAIATQQGRFAPKVAFNITGELR
jgi:serine/threonine protein kinase